MKRFHYGLSFITAIWFTFWFVLGFFLLYPGFAFTLRNPKRYTAAHKLRRVWAWWAFFWGGIRVKQVYEVPIDYNKPYVVTPNHSSILDIVTLGGKLYLDFNFMAKMELAYIPVFGIFFRTIDIAVDRKNARQAAKAYQMALAHLDKNKSIVIFPEGTIPASAPRLGRFKDGAFKMAIEKQVDILPVSIIGNWNRLPNENKMQFTPGRVIQYVHRPVSTKGMTIDQIDELKTRVFHIIADKLTEHGYHQRAH